MMAARLIGKAVVVRELMPQDLNRLAATKPRIWITAGDLRFLRPSSRAVQPWIL